MSLRQNAVKGVVWSAITGWGRQAIAFIVFFLLARLLGPETFGLIAMASVFMAFIQVFADQGFTEALIQRHQLDREHLDTAFWTNLGIGLLITVFCVGTAGSIADLFKQPELTSIIRWLSLSFLLRSLSSVQEAIFRRDLAFKILAIRSLVAVVIGGMVGVTMAFMGYGVWSLVGQQIVNSLVQILVLWWSSDWRPGFKVSASHFKDLFSFGLNVVGMNVLDFINSRADDFLIGYFLGSVALGYYSVAYRIMTIVIDLLTNVINQVAIPAFSRLQKEPERLRNAFYTVTKLTSLVSFPIFLGMAALAPELIRALVGSKWLPSIPVIQVLAFIGLLHSVYYFNATVIMAMGKPSWKLFINFTNSIANLISFTIAVQWGIVAVAAAFVIRGYVLSPIEIWVVWRLIRVNAFTYLSNYIAPLTGSLVMTAAILGIKYFFSSFLNLYILIAVCMGIGSLVYGLTVFLMAPTLFRQVLDLAQSASLFKMEKKT